MFRAGMQGRQQVARKVFSKVINLDGSTQQVKGGRLVGRLIGLDLKSCAHHTIMFAVRKVKRHWSTHKQSPGAMPQLCICTKPQFREATKRLPAAFREVL